MAVMCRLLGHKHERKIKGGGVESSEYIAKYIATNEDLGHKLTVRIRWCYRCERYIAPPLNITMVIKLFGDKA